jgi:hypothetical protein
MRTHEQHVEDLLNWYNSAPEDVKVEGRGWYDAQRELCRELSKTYGLHLDTVAAVIAALSPMTRWTMNVAGAIRMLRAFQQDREADPPRNCTLFYKNAEKAWAVLRGTSPVGVFGGSPKVYSFWCNLVGDENTVTVDTWMARAVGEDKAACRGIKPAMYYRITEAVRDAARQVGETPAALQAIVWVQIRREQSWYDTSKECV